MTNPSFRTQEVAKFYESIRPWSHPEHPFLDASYSPGSLVPAVDMTPFITDCLMSQQHEAIAELWSFLTHRNDASDYLFRKVMKADVSDWWCLSPTARCELKAINLLVHRAALTTPHDVSLIAAGIAATVVGCRQIEALPEQQEQAFRLTKSEVSKDRFPGSAHGVTEGARLALATAASPLAEIKECANRLKSVSPMARLVVADYMTRDWGQGLRLCLYYGERLYGCGTVHNQKYIEWLDFFVPPDDNTEPPPGVTKDVLRAALDKHGIACKKSASRQDMIVMAKTVPGLVASLIAENAPERRDLRQEWVPAVKVWTERLRMVTPVGGAILKTIALDTR